MIVDNEVLINEARMTQNGVVQLLLITTAHCWLPRLPTT